MSDRPSDMFLNAICDQGCPAIDCGCGRLNFASGSGSYSSEDEIAGWRECAKVNPDKFVEHDYDGVSFGAFEGDVMVHGCPCNKRLGRYEAFIWQHREMIVRYIKARTKRAIDDANDMARQMSEL